MDCSSTTNQQGSVCGGTFYECFRLDCTTVGMMGDGVGIWDAWRCKTYSPQKDTVEVRKIPQQLLWWYLSLFYIDLGVLWGKLKNMR